MTTSEYNFQYLLDISKSDENNHELNRIITAVDTQVSGSQATEYSYLFHLVPILYSVAITSGLCVWTYKIME